MSIYTAMRAGVSGLSANASALAAISDNVANINTTSYKRNIADFTAMVNGRSGSGTSMYSAGGVLSGVRRAVDIQGSLEQGRDGNSFAIQGRGFFIVSSSAEGLNQDSAVRFTRAGDFRVDASGFMRNAQGYVLQGWPIDANAGAVSSPTSLSALQSVNLSNIGASAKPTANTTFNANINAAQTIYQPAPIQPSVIAPTYTSGSLATGAITPHFETTVEIFDSLGSATTLAVGFLKTGVNQWQVEAYLRPSNSVTTPGGLVADGRVTFSPTGSIDTITATTGSAVPSIGGPFTITWDPTVNGASPQEMRINLSEGLTQFAVQYGVTSVVTDGAPPGDLVGTTLEENGILTAQFTNGRSNPIYRIPLATFLNPNGLQLDQGGVYRQTLESGAYTINASGAGSAGTIEAGSLEASNVDLGSEFTNMIQTQRAYSASSRIITTADEMLEELLRIKR